MAHSEQLRKIVLTYLAKGNTQQEAANTYSVSISSIKRWKKSQRESGTVAIQARQCTPYKIDTNKLQAYIKSHPDAYLQEIAAHFGVTDSGICKAFKTLKYHAKKKSTLYLERDEAKRCEFFIAWADARAYYCYG